MRHGFRVRSVPFRSVGVHCSSLGDDGGCFERLRAQGEADPTVVDHKLGERQAGQPLVVNNKFVAKGNIVLVDLRDSSEVAEGHIPRAVNIPMAALADVKDDFPSSKAAPIVVYGNGDDAKKARKMIKGWGYKFVSLTKAGIDGWKAEGMKLATGPAADEINWVRKLGKGEVNESEFMKTASGSASNAVILDVRTSDETQGGIFKSAITIPLDELANRTSELPKDKMIYIHCSTGARAEMAHTELKKNGFNTSFLVADVVCEDNECEIE